MAPSDSPQRWPVHRGEVVYQPATRLLTRTGRDEPWALPGDDVRVTASLGEGAVVAQLSTPQVVLPGATLHLSVGWPVVTQVWCADALVESFRLCMARTLLGAVGSGQVLPAMRVTPVDDALPAGMCALDVHIHNTTRAACSVRRIGFLEEGLTLHGVDDALHAGTLVATVSEGDQIRTHCTPPADIGDVLRPGDAGVDGSLRPTGLSWLLDSTRRSVAASQ